MSDPFKPTARVLLLLERVELGAYRGCIYSTPSHHRSYRDIFAQPYSGIRRASEKEISHLLTFNLVEQVRTPGNGDVFDTSNPKKRVQVGEGVKLVLKPMGKRLLEEAK